MKMRTLLVACVVLVCLVVFALSLETDRLQKLLSLSKREVGIQQLSDVEKSREKRGWFGRGCRVAVYCKRPWRRKYRWCRKRVPCRRYGGGYRGRRRRWYRGRWYRGRWG